MAKSPPKLGSKHTLELLVPPEIFGLSRAQIWANKIAVLGYQHTSGPPFQIALNYLGTITYNYCAPRRNHDLGDGQLVRIYPKRKGDGISVWLDQADEKPSVKPLKEIFPDSFIGPLEDRGVPGMFFVPCVKVRLKY
jgi:hypothetical protein